MTKRALVFLAEGFEEIEAITVIDILRRGGVEVTTVAMDGPVVTGSHGIAVHADCAFGTHPTQFDALVLPGGQPGTRNLASNPQLLQLIRDANQNGILCAAICAAPSVLAKAGILKERTATCYPGVETQLSGAVHSTEPVVVDGNVVTSRAVGTALAFGIELVALLTTRQNATQVANKALVDCMVP